MQRAILLLIWPVAFGLWQAPPRSAPGQQSPRLEFEAAAIHRQDGQMSAADTVTVSGTLVRLLGMNVHFLVMEAYDVRDYQVSLDALPKHDEIEDVFYDLVARAPGDTPPTKEQYREMLRSLLADRFKLSFHRENKEMRVYALLPGSKGSKLQENKDTAPCRVLGSLAEGGQKYQAKGCGTDTLAEELTSVTGRPVLDETQLTGRYDFSFVSGLFYRPRPDDISPFTAVRELGLELKPKKAPVPVIVVDHVEEPSAN